MTNGKILLVEDNVDLLEVLRLTFEAEGFKPLHTGNGEDALKLARRHSPDVVVLDVMLPGIDGIEVCRRMRSDPSLKHIPVLMLTARAEEADVVLGLGVGADDYVCKPARPRELTARVKSLLRRSRPRDAAATDELIVHGEMIIDPVRFEVRVGEQRLQLTPTEFRLLQTLAGSPGRVFRRGELIDYAIGGGAIVTERNIDTHIKAVRKKLGSCGDLIETIRGVGYRFSDDPAKIAVP